MIIYTPSPKNKTAIATSVILILSSLIFMGSSFALQSGNALLRMFALLFILLSLLIGERYLNCSYTYILEETDLVIQKKSLKKSITVCRIEYSGITEITNKQSMKKNKKKNEYKAAYNYCITMFYSDAHCILFDNGNEKAAIYFEPDEIFLSELRKRTRSENITIEL